MFLVTKCSVVSRVMILKLTSERAAFLRYDIESYFCEARSHTLLKGGAACGKFQLSYKARFILPCWLHVVTYRSFAYDKNQNILTV